MTLRTTAARNREQAAFDHRPGGGSTLRCLSRESSFVTAYSETQEFGAYMADLGLDPEAIDDDDIPVLAAGFPKHQSARRHVATKHPQRGKSKGKGRRR